MRATITVALVLLAGCGAPAGAGGDAGVDDAGPISFRIQIEDPLNLYDDVRIAGRDLRLIVVPAADYSCSTSAGTVSPEIPDAALGEILDAIVDVRVSGDLDITYEVPRGTWVVLVRDPALATGCGVGTDSATFTLVSP